MYYTIIHTMILVACKAARPIKEIAGLPNGFLSAPQLRGVVPSTLRGGGRPASSVSFAPDICVYI